MDLQFYGANCVAITHRGQRVVIDDNLVELGAKGVLKPEDVALYTSRQHKFTNARLTFDGPGEYEVSDISIIGLSARAHLDEKGQHNSTMFKLVTGELSVLVTGHIYPELSDDQLEGIGIIDILIVPVGGNGYTVDPAGALKLIKDIEPKLVIPTHTADKALKYEVPQQELANALKELGMEPRETTARLRVKPGELSDVAQLVVVEKS